MNIQNRWYQSVSIVIPTWNGLHLLKQSLDQVIRARDEYAGECEIIVVDNGSMDRTIDVILDYYPDVIINRFEKNTGFGHACNRGAELARGDLILFLNNDVFIPTQIIGQLVEAYTQLDNAFSICPETRYWSDQQLTDRVFSSAISFSYDENSELIQHWLVEDGRNLAGELEPTVYGTGAVLLVNKEKFCSLGGFDPIYGLAYWEDVDICLKAWNRGWGSYCASSIHAWHQVSATSGNNDSDFKKSQMTLNYILLQLIHIKDQNLLFRFTSQVFSLLRSLLESGSYDLAQFYASKIAEKYNEIADRRELMSKNKLDIDEQIYNKIYSKPGKGWSSKPIISELISVNAQKLAEPVEEINVEII